LNDFSHSFKFLHAFYSVDKTVRILLALLRILPQGKKRGVNVKLAARFWSAVYVTSGCCKK